MSALTEQTTSPIVEDRRRFLWIEFLVLTLYLFFYPFLSGFSSGLSRHDSSQALYSIVFEIGHIGVVLFVVWVADGNVRSHGLRRPSWPADLWLGLVVALLIFVLFLPVLWPVGPHHSEIRKPAYDAFVRFNFLIANLLFSIRHALIVAYAFGRLRELLGSYYWAMGLAASMYAVLHFYAGPGYMAIYWLEALMYVIIIWKVGRIWPLLVLPFASFIFLLASLIANGGR